MTTSTRFPARLPPGWTDAGQHGPYRLALGPASLAAAGFCPKIVTGGVAVDEPLDLTAVGWTQIAEMPALADEVMVLDEGPERCRGDDREARRFLYTCIQRGLSLTVEHWVVRGDRDVHLLAGVVPTATWPMVEPVLRRVLRSFWGAR